ncbi:MAG: fibronectin type III domain-containing protein [Bacteroidales bacterium]|nr:fibronectin type III domain-containing protein [Bacteroidales bacterium]
MRKYFSKLLLMVMFMPWVMQAQTTPAPASLPYTCGFEDATENANWVIENGASATNKFFIGSAVNNGGTQSLYVSDDNGVSNSYTSSSAAAGYVYAYREFTITSTAGYSIAFDWRAKGESTYDFLRVFLIPDNAADALTPSTGTSAHTGVTASASPASWMAIDNNVKLNLKDTWQSFVSEDLQLTPGTYKLVFYWRTDLSGTYDPPVAVDNVIFTEVTCPRPFNFAATTIFDNSATFSWVSESSSFAYHCDTANAPRQWFNTASIVNGNTLTLNGLTPNTAYTLYLQTMCGSDTSLWVSLNFRTACTPIASENIPYHESFESWASGAFDPCYVATNNNTSATNYPSVSTTYHSDSAKSMYMYSTAAYATWLTMPMFESPLNTLQVSFDLYRANATVYPFMVGVMSDPNDMSTFDTITTISCRTNNEWEHFTIPLSIYNGQGTFIAFVSPSGVISQNYIDNIVVEELAACPDPINVTAYATSEQDVTIAWTETGATGYIAEYGLMGFTRGTGTQEMGIQDSINLYGLNPATAYDIYLRADCGSDSGNWIGPITVRTACPEVMDISELSYIENFDSYVAVTNTTSYSADNNLPSCWDFYSNGTAGATAAYWPRIYRGTSYCPTSNDNALLMYICNYSGTTASSLGYVAERGTEKMAVLPVVSEPLNNVTITFDARVYTVTTSVIDTIFVAIATSDSTYIPLTHFEGVSGLQSIEVNLANYSNIIDTLTIENPRIAIVFKASTYATTSLRSNYLGVDNVTVAKNSPCIHPFAANIIGVTETSATFIFADSVDVGSYEVAWATANDVLLATSTNIITDTTGAITELDPNTEYFAWVRANCGGTYSSWEPFGEFRTLCTAVDSLPYSEDFDSYATGAAGTMNTCWTKGTNYTTAYPYVSSYSSSNRLYFYATSSYYSYAALPLFTAPLNTLQISFDLVKYSTYTSDLVLGVMSNPQDISTFVAIDTIIPRGSSGTINSYEISLEPYANLEGCIAFLSPISSSADYSYLDNVVVSELPACRKSAELAASNVTANSATLSWFNTTGDSYIVAYSRDANFDPDTCTTVVTTTVDSVVVTGLRPYSNYYFAVKAICGTDSGAWSFERGHFTTLVDCGTAELEEVVFGTATTTSSSYPMYSSSSYAKGRTWTIYTREELGREGIYGGNINSVAYQYTTTTPMPVDVNVYIAETSLNTMAVADTMAFNQMTQVFSGRLTFSADQDWNTIIFNNAFNYSGDSNLMIAVERVSTVSTTGYFKYTAGIGNKAIYSYINSSGSKYAYTTVNRANIKFNICNVIPACAYPRDVVVSNVTTTTADIAWNHTATNFTVAYGPVGFDLDSAATYQTVQANATSITLTGLTQNTDYDVYVRANCSATEISDWSFVESFNTPCDVISTLPYIENFDSYTTGVVTGTTAPTGYPNHVLPSCWTIYPLSETTSTYPQAFLTSSTTYAQEGNALFFKSLKSGSIFAIMPEVSAPIDSLMITFAYRNEGTTASNGILSLGVMSDIFDTTTFVELEAYPMTTTITNVEHMFSEDTITFTNDHVIAFRYKGGTASNYYMAIDNVVLDRRPACLSPVNVDVIDSTITLTSAEVTWTNREGDRWVIEYGPEGFELGQGTRVAANTNPFTITGLNHSTRYDVYVRAILNADSSAYSLDPATFKTTCGVIDSLPWTANLDGVWYYYTNNTTALYPMCWDVIDNGYVNSSGTHYNWRRTTTASYIRTGSAAIQFAGVTNTTAGSVHSDYLITPELQLTGNEQLVFWMRNSSSTTTVGTYDARVAIYALTSNSTDFVQVSPRIVMTGGQTTYTEHIIPLTGLTGNVKLAFVVDTNSYSFYIDDVTVEPIPSCPKPRYVTADSTSRTSVSLSWISDATEFMIDYKKAADTVWSTLTGIYNTATTVTNLSPSSTYQFRVKAVCMAGDSSVWSEIATANTECGTASLPFAEDFSVAVPANCWNIYTGIPFTGEAITSTTGIWTRVTTNNGIQGPHAKINNYGTGRKHWLVTPEIDLANESGAELTFDLALTDYNNADTIENTNTLDDKFMVIISRDGGNTWLREDATIWSDLETDSADYSYRGIRKTAERITIDLSQYYGDTIKIAFYAESTVTGGDNDLHIGNILVETSCGAPVVTDVTVEATTATITWASSATDFQIAYKEATAADWGAEINVTNATTYTITGLMPTTNYQYRIRTICEEGAYSGWREGAFTTIELPCTAPTNIVATNITYTSATLGWEGQGNELAWEVKYTTGGVEETIEATTNPVVIENLFSGSTYEVWVRAFCGAETYSDWSEVYTFTTAACEVPSNVTASDITASSAIVTWTSTAQRWEISYGMEGVNEENGIIVDVEGTPSYTIEGLDYETTYDVYVRAICEDGVYSAWTPRIQFTTDRIGINTADNDNVNVRIYPNPANTEATISVEGVNGNVEFVVADMNGRMVITETIACEGSLVKTIDVSNLAKGAYFVHIYNNNFNTTRKLIVK